MKSGRDDPDPATAGGVATAGAVARGRDQVLAAPGPTRRPGVRSLVALAAAGGAWAFAEATLFFVVPDVLVGYLALRSPRRAALVFVAVTLGALAGAAALYAAVAWAGVDVGAAIGALPGIRPTDIDATRGALETRGPPALLDGIVQGQPVKLYVYAAARLASPLPGLLVFVALNRCLRVGFTGIVCALLGRVGRPLVQAHPVGVSIAYGGFWVAFYAWFWLLRP